MKSAVIWTVTVLAEAEQVPLMSPITASNRTSVRSCPEGAKRVSCEASPILATLGQVIGVLVPNISVKNPPPVGFSTLAPALAVLAEALGLGPVLGAAAVPAFFVGVVLSLLPP